MKKSYYFLLVPLLAIALIGPGCSCGQKLAEKAVESSTNSDIDISDDKFTVNTNEGSMQWGEGAELPDDFPSDVPIYKNAKVTSSSTSTADQGYSASLSTTDSQSTVADYYKAELEKQGWTIDDSYTASDTSGKSTSYYASKGDRDLTIGVYKYTDEVSVTIYVSKVAY